MERHRGSRSVERAAVWAFLPVIAMAPFTVLALTVIWLPFRLLFDIRLWWVLVGFAAAGLLLFVRPFQVLVLTPMDGNINYGRRQTDRKDRVGRRATDLPAADRLGQHLQIHGRLIQPTKLQFGISGWIPTLNGHCQKPQPV